MKLPVQSLQAGTVLRDLYITYYQSTYAIQFKGIIHDMAYPYNLYNFVEGQMILMLFLG